MTENDQSDVGLLVDVSVPDPKEDLLRNILNENKENDPIELLRCDDDERRLSHTLRKCLEVEDRLLKGDTKKATGNAENDSSPEIQLLVDEAFDFDLVLSPHFSEEVPDEEEVFFGPVGLTERIVAATVSSGSEVKPLSPLNAMEMAEIMKEAHLVVGRIMAANPEESSDDTASPIKRKLFSPRTRTRKSKFDVNEDGGTSLPEKVCRPSAFVDNGGDTGEDILTNGQRCMPTERQTEDAASVCLKKKGDNNSNDDDKELKKPSRLTRLARNRSFTISKKANNNNNTAIELGSHSNISEATTSQTTTSDNSDLPLTKTRIQTRRSLQQTQRAPVSSKLAPKRASGLTKPSNSSTQTAAINKSNKNPETSTLQAPASTAQTSSAAAAAAAASGPRRSIGLVRPASNNNSLTVKNIKKSMTLKKPDPRCRTYSNSSNSSLNSTASSISSNQHPVEVESKTAAAPLKKLKLMQPGKLQTSLNFNRSKISAAMTKKSSGPMKAVVPVMAAIPQTQAKSPSTKARGTPVKPDRLGHTLNLSCSFGSPVRSGSQSSYGESTPKSGMRAKRKSFLPTPSKSSTSSIPASPYSMRCFSTSSNSSASFRKSLSVSTDSLVFITDTASQRVNQSVNPKAFDDKSPTMLKPRRPMIQHTPDVPKRLAASRWSPMRRTRQLTKDEQVMQCTKRIPRESKK